MEHPLQLILLCEAHKSVERCKELEGTQLAESLKDIFTQQIKQNTGTLLNAAILKLLRNLDVVPLLVGIKDAAVLVWLLAEEADSVFDQDCLISLL